MHFDRFDIAEAYFVFAMDYHTGQGSREYAIHSAFDRIRFQPRASLSERTLTENGQAILARLVECPERVRDRRAAATE